MNELEQLKRELAEAIKERDAAFAMFKCECRTDEACRNLAALHSNLASVKARLDTSDAMLREEWAAHQDTKADLAEARKDAERYQTARCMNVQQWKDAFLLNIKTGKPFDEIIDDLRPFMFPPRP